MPNIVTLLTTSELLKVHNAIAKTPLVKFRDRRTAESKVDSLTIGMGEKLVAVFKKVGINEEIVKELELKLKPKPVPPPVPEKKKKGFEAHPMLQSIRELIRATKPNEKGERSTSTADIAELLGVKTAKVVLQCDKFSEQLLVHIEDDSVSKDDPFYYIHLTELGMTCDVEEGDPCVGLGRGKKEKVNGNGEPREWKPRAAGERMDFAGKTIKRLTDTNSRMKGSARWSAFEMAKDGLTYDKFLELGGAKKHIVELVRDQIIELV